MRSDQWAHVDVPSRHVQRGDVMIELQIDGDKYDLAGDVRSHIEDRIGGLDEYMDTLESGHVTVSWEGGKNEQTQVRAQVWGPGHHFEASDTDWQAVSAVDKTRHKLETQIRREHNKEISERDRR
jgi:ribosomal subunit interface protein